jgi:hypothetical protein
MEMNAHGDLSALGEEGWRARDDAVSEIGVLGVAD